jgi:hypothetical protein
MSHNFSAGILRKSNNRQRGLHFEILSSEDNFRQIPKIEAQKDVKKIGKKWTDENTYKKSPFFDPTFIPLCHLMKRLFFFLLELMFQYFSYTNHEPYLLVLFPLLFELHLL